MQGKYYLLGTNLVNKFGRRKTLAKERHFEFIEKEIRRKGSNKIV